MNKNLSDKTNFYFPTLLLPAEKRKALLGLYGFCRKADDIADEPGSKPSKRMALARFRRELERGWAGRSRDAFMAPFLETARPLGLTLKPLQTILEGIGQDIRGIRFQTFAQLHAYTLKVAGAPGLACMEIFGYRDEPHRRYALNLGVFLQLTNVMRDVKEDLSMGRLYLPASDWKRFGLTPGKLPPPGPAWDSFVRFQLDRALDHWREACRNLDYRERADLETAEAIAAVYRLIHRKLYVRPSLALSGRARVSSAGKILAVFWTWLRWLPWRGWP